MSEATRELFLGAVRTLRRSTLWWSVALSGYVVLNLAFWPSFENSDMLKSFDDMGAIMEAFGAKDLASPAGYLDGQVFALMLPILMSAMMIAATTAITSGDEDAGRLELLHALPVSRSALWLTRLAGALVMLAVTTAMTLLMLVISIRVFSLDGVGVVDVAGPLLGSAALAMFHGAVGFAAGAAGLARPRSITTAVAVLVAGYLVALVLPIAKTFESARNWSPWHWALGQAPAVDGVGLVGIGGLVAAATAIVWVGGLAIEHRDIRTA